MHSSITVGYIGTPFGPLTAMFTRQGLARLAFGYEDQAAGAAWAGRWKFDVRADRGDPRFAGLAAELAEYSAGQRRDFTTPLDLRGTPFQVAVWQEVRAIGYGETRAYSEVAAGIGRPLAIRAVGAANGANPLPILVPCHRLLGKEGALVKYGGGLALKRRLLELEGVALRR